MDDDMQGDDTVVAAVGLRRKEAASRALAEAEARRAADAPRHDGPVEHDGRGGPDPARYGDWEIKGVAVDF